MWGVALGFRVEGSGAGGGGFGMFPRPCQSLLPTATRVLTSALVLPRLRTKLLSPNPTWRFMGAYT